MTKHHWQYGVVGYARSGTHWLRRLIADAIETFVWESPRRSGKVVSCLNWHVEPLPDKIPSVYIHRDPRDVLVSMREFWNFDSIDDIFQHKPDPAPTPVVAMARMHNYWTESREIATVTSYTHLINDTKEEFQRILNALGIDREVTDEFLVPHEWKTNRDHFHSLGRNVKWRSGPRIGAWKDVLNRSQGELINRALWDWIWRLGYDDNPEWWRELPKRAVPDSA